MFSSATGCLSISVFAKQTCGSYILLQWDGSRARVTALFTNLSLPHRAYIIEFKFRFSHYPCPDYFSKLYLG